MTATEPILGPTPADARARELWMQHAVGYLLFRDVGGYARARIDPALDAAAREAAERAIDDALYGLMMVLDGVTGGLRDSRRILATEVFVHLLEDGEVSHRLDLSRGDGMCMGYHRWREGDFGDDPVVT